MAKVKPEIISTETEAVANNVTESIEQKVETNETVSIAKPSTAPAPDPFDPASLRLDQSFVESAEVKKLLTTIPVCKPHKQAWFRVHPDAAYRETLAMIVLKDEREYYLLPPPIARSLPGEFDMVHLYTAIDRQGNLFLWPVHVPGPDDKKGGLRPQWRLLSSR